jgi:hypothetical protein
MHLDWSADNIERYKVEKETTKRVVSEARSQMYDRLYQWLGMKGRRTSIGWTKAESERRGTSSKLNALKTRHSDS